MICQFGIFPLSALRWFALGGTIPVQGFGNLKPVNGLLDNLSGFVEAGKLYAADSEKKSQ